MEQAKDQSQQYQRKMTSRHLFMLSLGGVIGTGLFLSSEYTIHQAGPAGTILAYLVGALIVYLVMLCLGELSVAMPVYRGVSYVCNKIHLAWYGVYSRLALLADMDSGTWF